MKEMNGLVISEVGFKDYIKGAQAAQFSNIKPLRSQKEIQRDWDKCNMGCHVPSYRVLRKQATYNDLVSSAGAVSPLLAGGIAGVYSATVQPITTLTSGIVRTGEGLGLAGMERVVDIGIENRTAFSMLRATTRQLLETDLTSIDNPLTQLVFAVVYEYIKLIPEWVIAEVVDSNALVFPDDLGKEFVLNASNRGLIDSAMVEHLDAASEVLKQSSIKLTGKKLGERITQAIACIIAARVTRKIMISPGITWGAKKQLAGLRKFAKTSGGATGKVLMALLKAQGLLGRAASTSRRLEQDCPKLWHFLRYKCGGIDMLLFLVEGSVKEYLDTISVLEKDPVLFMKMMKAMIEAGKTTEIFLPQ